MMTSREAATAKRGPSRLDESWTPTAFGAPSGVRVKRTFSVVTVIATVRFGRLSTSGLRYAVAEELPAETDDWNSVATCLVQSLTFVVLVHSCDERSGTNSILGCIEIAFEM